MCLSNSPLLCTNRGTRGGQRGRQTILWRNNGGGDPSSEDAYTSCQVSPAISCTSWNWGFFFLCECEINIWRSFLNFLNCISVLDIKDLNTSLSVFCRRSFNCGVLLDNISSITSISFMLQSSPLLVTTLKYKTCICWSIVVFLIFCNLWLN